MKTKFSLIALIVLVISIYSCTKDEVVQASHYYNQLSFPDTSSSHPKAAKYQSIIDEFANSGGLGLSVMIRDQHGTWLGTAGYADIASNVILSPGNRFLIASSSKTMTATAAFALIEDGLFSLDDPVNKWIDKSITDEIENANESTVKDLIGHTSCIRDIYNTEHLMKYMNQAEHHWEEIDILKFVYGKKAYFDAGERWQYSNINYILLGMIMEKASGLTLSQIYQQKIFDPLGLKSAHYDIGDKRLPAGTVKGYTDIHSNNIFVEATDFYYNDIGVGGDGGVVINAQDLGFFFDALLNGQIVNQSSLDQMQDWFEGGYSTEGQAGYGLYSSTSEYGQEIGHGGGIIGFESGMDYFVDHDVTIVKLTNTDLILTTEEYDNIYNKMSIDLKKVVFE